MARSAGRFFYVRDGEPAGSLRERATRREPELAERGDKGTLTGLFAPPEKPKEMCSVKKSMSKSPPSLSG